MLDRQQQLDDDERLLMTNRYLSESEREYQRLKLQKEREDLAFGLSYMRREQSRDWDLNDPARLAKMQKTRVDAVD